MKKNGLLLLFFCGLSFLFYFLIINRPFVCDDYTVLKRVAIDKIIFIKGFFRPLSDFTLYFNYLIGGFHAWGYYVFNILIHGINSFLLFQFCSKWKWTDNAHKQQIFAFTASLLFLTYPFHNECIVWVLGRASLMASTFGILGLLILVSSFSQTIKIVLVCLCWFIGLTAYESIFLLPLMIFVITYKNRSEIFKRNIIWIVVLSATLICHLIFRLRISGGFLGSYGQNFFTERMIHYAANFFKVAGRLFLPPVQNYYWQAIVFVLLGGLIAGILFFFFRKFRTGNSERIFFYKMIVLLVVTAVIPVLFSVSTKTSESDRFLYFPSFFLCALIAFLMVNLLVNKYVFIIIALFLLSYNIFFLEKNNENWIKASDISKDIISTIKSKQYSKKIYIINLPEEKDGAFIFRSGLEDALMINGVNSDHIKIVNLLKRKEMLNLPEEIEPEKINNEIRIPPVVDIKTNKADSLTTIQAGDSSYISNDKESVILYWNKKSMITLQR
ncbi:MAG TPA: hypothetical protein VKR53_09905 [Puia sp.]|nr:hypothetical protein [Puia sp.]